MSIVRQTVSFVACAALSVGLFTANANAGKPKFAQKSDSTIVNFAIAASENVDGVDVGGGEDFDILVAALVTTSVVGIFDGRSYTVFAPNDQAFYDLANALKDEGMPDAENDEDALNILLDKLSGEEIAAVLAYHVTKGVRNSRTVTRAKQIKMLDGNTVSGRTMPGFIEANKSVAELLDTDNRLADGMVHVIDAVLLP